MELNYKKIGSGPPILILHGLFGMLDNWVSFARKLGNHYTVYLLDLRNHGRSPHDVEMSYEIMAEDVHDFMNDNDLTSAHIIGHSMGGKVAMVLALNFPDVVKKLIVIDIAPKAYPPGHREILDAMLNINFEEIHEREGVFNYLILHIKEEAIVRFLMKNIMRTKEGHYQWRMNLTIINDHYQEIIDLVGAPWSFKKDTMFVRGEKSNYINEEDEDFIHQLFPKSFIITIKNAGHWIHAEQPELLLNEVLGFLEE